MPVTKAQKEKSLSELKVKFTESQVAIFADYRGLTVAEATKLRRQLRDADCELKIAKNTMTILATKALDVEGAEEYLKGPVAIAFGKDPVTPAKIMSEFIRETKRMEIKAGVLEGKVIDAAGVMNLANLPSREVLLAKVLGGMQSPMYGFAGSLHGLLRNFVYALEGVRKQRTGEA